MTNQLRNQVMNLSEEERLALLVEIWDSLTDTPSTNLTDEERKLIETRLREHEDFPGDTIPLEEVERRLRKDPV